MTDRSARYRREWVPILSLVLISIVAQSIALTRFDDLRFFQKYWQLAAELASGEISTDRLNDVSPLYLWFVAALQKVGFTPAAIRVLQLLMNGATCLLAGAIALRVAGPLASFLTTLFLVLNQALFINATELEPESLIVLLNTGALYFLFGRTSPRGGSTFAAGLLFGLSATARLVIIPAAILAGCVVLWQRRAGADRSPGKLAASYLIGLATPLLAMVLATLAVTGSATIMNPGTVFFEGWNPHTSGYALTEPLIVSDVRAEIDAPDPLHLAYRLIASRIEGEPPSPELANRFWTDKATAWIRAFPTEAARLGLAKLFFSVHSYEAWDLRQVVGRFREADAFFWIPFGVLFGLAVVSVIDRPRDPVVVALWLYSLCFVAVMVAFYVTSRQRNAMLPAMAILAGIGVATLAARFRSNPRGVILRSIFVILTAVLLTRSYAPQTEDEYGWTAASNSEAVVAKRREAQKEGRTDDEMRLRAIDRTWILGDDPHIPAAPPALVSAVAKGELSRATTPQRIFDLALALQYARDWETSDEILAFLDEDGYRPIRQAKAVDSVSYYRALAALHTSRSDDVRTFLETASEEDPADSHVLALRSIVLGDEAARSALFLVHDRFTVDMALARAHYETGNIEAALHTIRGVTTELPEWNRARLLEAYLSDLTVSSDPSAGATNGRDRAPIPADH